MNFLAINYNTIKELVSTKELQSSDYEQGRALSESIKNHSEETINLSLKTVIHGGGLYIVNKNNERDELLVFDTTTFNGFNKNISEIITILQKSSRLAIRIWDKIGHSPCEKIISDTSYIALLPFSFSTGKSYKVILDKYPDKDRQAKRNENSLLIFSDGYENNTSAPTLSNFRKARENFNTIDFKTLFKAEDNNIKSEKYIKIETIDQTNGKIKDPFMGLEFWKNNLTENQSKFVNSDSMGPDILKGAAGTGKTLSLILRCVTQLKKHEVKDTQFKAILLTHSIATKENIENLIVANGGGDFIRNDNSQSVLITTLQEWCINNLGNRIEATEYLDCDALESKQLQLLYISEALDDFLIHDYVGAQKFISKELYTFFGKQDTWTISLMLQDEISTYIKGRASEDIEIYKTLTRSENSIPLKSEDDFNTIYSIFNRYQEKLISLNLFDSDDITLSALKETSTPIWKRRRINDGYDVMYIDETHLFNINELSLFHNLLKPKSNNIIFTIDRSQASGDSSISEEDVALGLGHEIANKHGFNAIFRSSDQIVNLASCVLASGANLFNDLENPLLNSSSVNMQSEQVEILTPYIISVQNIQEMMKNTFSLVDSISERYNHEKSEILIIPCNNKIFDELKNYSSSHNKPIISIDKRGNTLAISEAKESKSYIMGGMDYIGGLEFSAAIVVGIDNDKFPESSHLSGESNHFINYSAFNKLYVAITRAKDEVVFLHEKTKKISHLLDSAIKEGLVIYK